MFNISGLMGNISIKYKDQIVVMLMPCNNYYELISYDCDDINATHQILCSGIGQRIEINGPLVSIHLHNWYMDEGYVASIYCHDCHKKYDMKTLTVPGCKVIKEVTNY
jgi:hypothetical protein